MSKVFKTKKFIEKARKVHGDKYDYSLVDYINAKTKVKIICKIHGIFEQKPDAHINQKQGCPKCAGVKKLTQKEFIKKAKLIHGNTYNYSLVKYKNSTTKICIICPVHGKFWQSPNKHLKGQGCPKCSGNTKLTIEEFIKRSEEIHGNKYDYSEVEYKNAFTKVKIICPKHGEFEQGPNNHLQGQGCPKCSLQRRSDKRKNVNFIKDAKVIHGNKYDYSEVEYKNAFTKVKIICPKHGEFLKSPNNHLSKKQGCPKCSFIEQLNNSNYISGQYIPKYPERYNGDVNHIIYRSSYELKAFQMIEESISTSNNIISWGYETEIIPYKFKNKNLNYYVDIKLETKLGIYLIEIKPELQTKEPTNNNYFNNKNIYDMNKAKWNQARIYCIERGWKFKIWTEKELGI